MVLATINSCWRLSTGSPPREVVDMHQPGEGRKEMALHDRLVAYVHAIDNPHHDGRSEVWVEHSYAQCGAGACGGGGGGAGVVRVLLGPRREAGGAGAADVDVETPPRAPPSPPLAASPPASDAEDDEGADDDDWEARLAALAPHADHARLAAATLDCLNRVRLAKLAGGRFAERAAVSEQARRLRLALAPLWAGAGAGGAAGGGAAAWLHAALPAVAPAGARRRYERVAAELRRLVPRLAERLTGPRPAAPLPLAADLADHDLEPAVGGEAGPWLVWVGGGRWARLLRARVHTRALPLYAATQPPEPWCASVAGSVRAAFADILAEAGSRGVVVGGCGGGAALAGALARGAGGGAGVRGALLLAPALSTAEGAREGATRLARGAALVVAGGAAGAGAGGAGALREALGARTRLLLLHGADHALRLPARALARRALTQRAVDAALVEECVRWIHETCEETDEEPDDDAQATTQGTSIGTESSEEEYAHLPTARSPPAPAPAPAPVPVPPLTPIVSAHTTGSDTRSIEIVEGRVVSRVSGGTPLALLPPRREARTERRAEPRAERRAEPRAERRAERRSERRAEPASVPLAAADIMQLPIVFADDERTVAPHSEVAVSEGPVTVTSGSRRGAGGAGGAGGGGARRGAVRYTRVIVAKRAAPAPPPARPPLLVRRGLRLVPRPARDA